MRAATGADVKSMFVGAAAVVIITSSIIAASCDAILTKLGAIETFESHV